MPCGRLSWLLVRFWAHVNIVLMMMMMMVYSPAAHTVTHSWERLTNDSAWLQLSPSSLCHVTTKGSCSKNKQCASVSKHAICHLHAVKGRWCPAAGKVNEVLACHRLSGIDSWHATDVFRQQFGFRPTGSTTCALTCLLHHVTRMLERCSYVRCIMIDFSKAFDRGLITQYCFVN